MLLYAAFIQQIQRTVYCSSCVSCQRDNVRLAADCSFIFIFQVAFYVLSYDCDCFIFIYSGYQVWTVGEK